MLFPNPTNGIITIAGENIREIEVMNISGHTIKQFAIKKYQFDIDLSNQAKGLYYIKILTDKELAVKKIMVK